VPVLQGIIGLLYGSIVPAGRHFAGEEYRGRVAGESVGRRPGCRVACRDGHGARARRPHGVIDAGHRRVGRHLPRPVGVRAPGRCSPIWRPQSPTAPTASTASANCAATVSTCSGRRRRPPRCGGWSINGSTPHTCPGSARPGASPERRRGRQGPPLLAGSGCTSTSTPRWSSSIPTTRNWRRRPGRKPTVTTRCWRFWTAPRSPG